MNNKNVSRRKVLVWELVLFLALVLFDQWTKSLAVSALKGKDPAVMIPGVLELYYLENTGAAFSMLENAQWLFALIFLIFTGLVVWEFFKKPLGFTPLERWCIAAIYGVRLIDDATIEVALEDVDMRSDGALFGIPVLRLAECGDEAQWSPESGQYGHPFGDVSAVDLSRGTIVYQSAGLVIPSFQ